METVSRLTGISYDISDRRNFKEIYNTKEVKLLRQRGVYCIDYFNGVDSLVFVFKRDEEFRVLHDLWCRRLLDDLSEEGENVLYPNQESR